MRYCDLVAKLCLTLYDSMNCGSPGSSVLEIFQGRILEWVAIPFSRGSSLLRDRTQVSCIAGRFLYCLSHQGKLYIWLIKENYIFSLLILKH